MKKSDIRNYFKEDPSMNEDKIEGFMRCWDFTKHMTKFSNKELLSYLQEYETSQRIHKKIADLENEIQLLKDSINE